MRRFVTPIGETHGVGKTWISDAAYLRLLVQDDAEELHALIEGSREHLSPWLPWAAGQTFLDTVGFIRRSRTQLFANNGFQAAIVEGDRIAGVAGFHAVSWESRGTSIGYWLGEGGQGRGLMTGAVRLLTEHAMSVWSLHRVEIRAAVENRRSRAVPERLGFREEGVLRGAELVAGRFLDNVVYAVLEEEWDGGAAAGGGERRR